jgi:mannosyltransferase
MMGVVTGHAGGPTAPAPSQQSAAEPVPARHADGPAWVAIIPALITLTVTTYQIRRPSLWRDEGATLAAVHRSLPQLLRMLGHTDVVNGAYYVLMWSVARMAGTSALALRLPSAVGMAMAAGVTAALGRRLVSARAGLAAGLVFAALPSVTWYAQNARSYALVTAIATIASYLLVRSMAALPGRNRRWLAGYGVSLAALGLGNIFALLLIPAHGLTLALWARHDRAASADAPPAPTGKALPVRGWLAASAAAVAVASPVIVISIGQRGEVGWLKRLDAAEVASTHQLLGPPALAVLVLLVIVATLAFCARRGRLAADMPSRLLALSLPWLLLPPAVLLAAAAVHPVYALRYVMFCAPAAALLAGAGLASLGQAGGAAGLALIVLVALPGQTEDRRVSSHSEDLRQLSHLVATHRRPGDALLFPRLSDREFEAAYPSPYRPLRDVTLAQTPTQSATLLGTPATAQVIRHRLTTVDRLWVVETGTERGNVSILDGLGFQESHRWTVTGIWLVLYTRPG